MKHPNNDEWVPYLFGEAKPEERQRLSQHLQECPHCRTELAGWQRSLQKLDSWKLPPAASRTSHHRQVFAWAAAACLLLAAGFGLGNLGSERHRAERDAKFDAAVKTAVATELQQTLAQVHHDFSDAIAAAELRASATSAAELRQLARNWLQVLDEARLEDREVTRTLLGQVQQNYETQLLGLRRDLETVASLTDDQIREANFTMTQLAASRPLLEPAP